MCFVNPSSPPSTPMVMPPPATPEAHASTKDPAEFEENVRSAERDEGGKNLQGTQKKRVKRPRAKSNALQIASSNKPSYSLS